MKELIVSRTIASILMIRKPSWICCTWAIQFPSKMFVTIGGTSCSMSPVSCNLPGSCEFERMPVYSITYCAAIALASNPCKDI
eukprot:9237578-Pyramimonas_sp.AAC.1